MVKIERIVATSGRGGSFFFDRAAIQSGAVKDGFIYKGRPITPGFTTIVQPAATVCTMLILDDGQVAYGDCTGVSYAARAGRAALLTPEDIIMQIDREIAPKLEGRNLVAFKELAEEIDTIRTNDGELHTATRYGITQALLDAVAKIQRKTMAEVISEEYRTTLANEPIPIFAQSGDEIYDNADQMILHRVAALPHGNISTVSKLRELSTYIQWLKTRIDGIAGADYKPTFHFDTYGTFGLAFNNDISRIVEEIRKLSEVAHPYSIRFEDPVCMTSREEQVETMRKIRQRIRDEQISAGIVADEWAGEFEFIKMFVEARAADMHQIKAPDLGGLNNTVEAVLYCKNHGVGSYLGGSAAETDISTRVCAHIAMATQPDQVLAKPNVGGRTPPIVYNEMQRILALSRTRN